MNQSGEYTGDGRPSRVEGVVLLASIFVVAASGLGYELLAGTLSSYLLGNSVTQFCLVIGLFLSAMGVGSFLSRFVRRRLVGVFLLVELAIGVIGGLAPLGLFFAFAVLDTYTPLLVAVCLAVGALVGLEIPLLVRIVRARTTLRAALGNVLSIDYLGALAVSLGFPLLMLPHLGLVRSGALFGLLNVAVAAVGLRVLRRHLARTRALTAMTLAAFALLGSIFVTGARATTLLEDLLYDDAILYAKTTPYQRVVVTRWRDDVRLFLNGNLQFSTVDEYRYHESLVHPAVGLARSRENVLILGGGDGLAARELLRYPEIKRIVIVDLDPEITRLFSENPLLAEVNGGALNDRRVEVVSTDAQQYLEATDELWDVIIADLPDPNDESVGKLYTRSFFRLVTKRMTADGLFVTQATSPYYATDAFWCIVNTLAASSERSGGPTLHVLPYHASVPSFGDWGFVLASRRPLSRQDIELRVPTRYLSPELLPALFTFPRDIGPRGTPVNRLDNQALVALYRRGFRRFQ